MEAHSHHTLTQVLLSTQERDTTFDGVFNNQMKLPFEIRKWSDCLKRNSLANQDNSVVRGHQNSQLQSRHGLRLVAAEQAFWSTFAYEESHNERKTLTEKFLDVASSIPAGWIPPPLFKPAKWLKDKLSTVANAEVLTKMRLKVADD
jgi:hypothetical protein